MTAILDICFLVWVNSVKQICYSIITRSKFLWNMKRIVLYNQLVSLLWQSKEATFLNCGNILRAFSTTSLNENLENTWGNDLKQSNNEKDWIICSQASKCTMLAYEEGSETIMEWVWENWQFSMITWDIVQSTYENK